MDFEPTTHFALGIGVVLSLAVGAYIAAPGFVLLSISLIDFRRVFNNARS